MFLITRYRRLPNSIYQYKFFKTPTFGGFYFLLNPSAGPFKDKRLRTFFKYAVRSHEFSYFNQWNAAIPSNHVLPYGLTGHGVFPQIENRNPLPFPPEKPVTIRCLNGTGGVRKQLFNTLKKKLKKYNINLDLQWDTLANTTQKARQGHVDLTTYYYMVDVPLSSYFYETLFTPGHELNLFDYAVPEALELLTAYRKEKDELKQLKILGKLEKIAQEEAFLIPLMSAISVLGHKPHVKNVSINKYLYINLEDIDVQ